MSGTAQKHHPRRSRVPRLLLILGMLLPLLAFPTAGVAQQGHAPQGKRPPLDLAAMALTPANINDADLVWEGSVDYAHRASELLFSEAYIEIVAETVSASNDQITEAFEEAGLIRAHLMYLSPRTVADGDAERTIVSLVVEFADRDGAAAAWAFLRDQPALPTVTEIEDLAALGEASHAILEEGEDTSTGDPYVLLETSVLLGRLHLGVLLVDWGGTVPSTDDAEALTQTLVENVETGLASPDPGLSNRVVRLNGDTVNTTRDTYTLRNGRIIRLYNDTFDPAETESIEANIASTGLTDDYQVWQELLPSTGKQEDDSVYYLALMQFVDEQAAAAWLAERPDAIESYENFTDVEFAPEDEVDYGDAGFSYTAESVNTGTHFHNFTIQLDDQIVVLDVSGPTMAPVAAIAPLVEAQLACLEKGNCQEPMELPDALEDFVAETRG